MIRENEDEQEDIWFDDDDETEGTEDVPPEASPGSPEGLRAVAVGSLNGPLAKRLMSVLGLSAEDVENVEKQYEEVDEMSERGKKISDEAAELANEKTIDEIAHMYVLALIARLMKSHCKDCMKQLKSGMISTIESIPVEQVLRERNEHKVKYEGEEND